MVDEGEDDDGADSEADSDAVAEADEEVALILDEAADITTAADDDGIDDGAERRYWGTKVPAATSADSRLKRSES